jgi:hypothetical protein
MVSNPMAVLSMFQKPCGLYTYDPFGRPLPELSEIKRKSLRTHEEHFSLAASTPVCPRWHMNPLPAAGVSLFIHTTFFLPKSKIGSSPCQWRDSVLRKLRTGPVNGSCFSSLQSWNVLLHERKTGNRWHVHVLN